MEPFSDLNGAVEKDGAQEGRSATSPCGDVPDWFRRLCCRLGMSDAAPDGWLIYHVKPYVACFGCLTATFAGVAITAPIYMFASQPFRWYHHSLSITHTVAHLTLFGIIWRGGPLAARTWLARISMATVVGSMGTSSLLMILGPDELAIFQSKLAFIVVFSMFMWLTTYSAFLGSWAPDKPSQPYRNILQPLAEGTVRAFRVIDAYTDMLIIKIMLDKAKPPCVWFGQPGQCSKWLAIAAVGGVFTSADLFASVFLGLSGSNLNHQYSSERVRKFFLGVHVVSFICELSVIVVMLVKLCSDLSLSGEDSGVEMDLDAAQVRKSIVLTCVSVCITIATFSMTMLGTKRILGVARRIATSARARVSSAPARSGAHASTGAAVAPVVNVAPAAAAASAPAGVNMGPRQGSGSAAEDAEQAVLLEVA